MRRFIAVLILFAMLALLVSCSDGDDAFIDLDADDITAASVTLLPPGETVEIVDDEDRAELARLLSELVVYGEDPKYGETIYYGQTVVFTVTTEEGTFELLTSNPYVRLDGVYYSCDEKTSLALCDFANGFIG